MPILSRRPGSFPRLVWLGFLCVTLPLGVALVSAGSFAGRFARQAGEAVQHAARVTDDSRRIRDQVVSLERRARQLFVLGDEQLLHDYSERREGFRDTLGRLLREFPGPAPRDRLEAMGELEEEIYTVLAADSRSKETEGGVLDRFGILNSLSKEILEEGSRFGLDAADALQDAASAARRRFLWQASALVPVTLLVSAFFAALLARPVRQIDQAIQGLGSGDFSRPITVRGPRDLEFLGERLNWLRLRLAGLEAEKTRFLAHMSHELKTPLTAIREGSELLQEGVVGSLSPEQREVANILKGNAVRLQGLIENLLRFSLEMARPEPPGEAWTDLAGLAEEVLQDHSLASAAKGVAWERNLQPTRVRGHRERLSVILDNLLSNAVKFTPEGGTIGVRVFRDGAEAVIEVRDTGPGIPAEERERVFEPFYQGSARSRGAVQGSGLGLSIVAEYVDRMGGRVGALDPGGPGALLQVRFRGEEMV